MNGVSISDAMASPALFGPSFMGESWNVWRVVLKAAFGEPLDGGELEIFKTVAGDRAPPSGQVAEFDCIVGRGGGKDSVAAFIAAWKAATFDPRGKLRPGERASVVVIAVNRHQAAIAFDYIRGYFEAIPALAAMVVSRTDESVELNNGVIVEVHTNSFRGVRGRSIICAIFDEVCFWRSEESANPDEAVHGAVSPGLGRMPGSMLIMISSAHTRSGLLYEAWRDGFGRDDPDRLVVFGTTRQFNPTFSEAVIEKALKRDRQFFAAEYFSEWRSDLSGFLDGAWVERAATLEVGELPHRPGIRYFCFLDASSGRKDAMTLSVAHKDGPRVIVDVVRGRKAPFDPASVVQEFSEVMTRYHLARATADRYAVGWVVSKFAEHHITIDPTDKSRSEIYLECEPLFAEGTIEIPADHTLLAELRNLERRTHRGAKDSVDHPIGGHDDFANSCCGAAVLASSGAAAVRITPQMLAWSTRSFTSAREPRIHSLGTIRGPGR